MKKHYGRMGALGGMLGLVLLVSAGCGILPELSSKEEERNTARLEISLAAAAPEEVAITWDPASMAVDSAEVSVSDSGRDFSRTIIVTIQLRPDA